MTLAMALLSTGDATIKILSARYDRAVFMSVAGFGLVVIFFVVARIAGQRLLDRRALGGAPLLRSFAEVVAAFTIMLALARVPFSIVTLILQAMPLMVTAGAVLFLRERVGPHRWIAILVGFIGVIVILRPTGESFEPDWLLAVVTAIALSARDLISRAVPREFSSLQISAWGAIAVTIVGIGLQLGSGNGIPQIAMADWPGFILIVICWGGGVLSITAAMRTGEVGVVAPFRYMRLPFGLLIGVVVFSETIDTAMLVGAAIIVASGLYVLMRERRSV